MEELGGWLCRIDGKDGKTRLSSKYDDQVLCEVGGVGRRKELCLCSWTDNKQERNQGKDGSQLGGDDGINEPRGKWLCSVPRVCNQKNATGEWTKDPIRETSTDNLSDRVTQTKMRWMMRFR